MRALVRHCARRRAINRSRAMGRRGLKLFSEHRLALRKEMHGRTRRYGVDNRYLLTIAMNGKS